MANIINVSKLGSLDIIRIENKFDEIYLIDKNTNVEIINSNVTIIDITKDGNVNINVNKDSVLKYFILLSQNTDRIFDVSGNVNVISVSLDDTHEMISVNLLLENAEFNLKRLVYADNFKSGFVYYVDHKNKSTFSNIENVGIASNGAKIIFDVTGKIESGMAKSRCSQLSKGILMDDESVINAKPILLIDEFDCFANHGASIGKMSDEALFYIRSRGLTKEDAFFLIISGIVNPYVDSIPDEKYKEEISGRLSNLIKG